MHFNSIEELMKYREEYPSIPKELLEMAKKDQEHLHAMERGELALYRRGQLFGLIVALSFLCAATILILANHDTAGTIVGSTDLVALVAVFVLGKRSGSDSIGLPNIGSDNVNKDSELPINQAIAATATKPELSDEDRKLWQKLSRDIGIPTGPPSERTSESDSDGKK
jgi:uncharacterized membrane protein